MSALPAVLAVVVAAAFVLFDVVSNDRAHAPVEDAARPVGDASLFSALERGEVDEGPAPARQRSAAAVLLVLTLIAAAVLGGGIYLGLSALRAVGN